VCVCVRLLFSFIPFPSPFLPRKVDNPYWLAPEILQKDSYSTSSDVYSFGIIFWEILSRQVRRERDGETERQTEKASERKKVCVCVRERRRKQTPKRE